MDKHKGWTWRALVHTGKWKKALGAPLRERIMVRKALTLLRLRYREVVSFWNPLYGGWKNDQSESMQWLDFVLFYKRRIAVLLFHPARMGGGAKAHEKVAFEKKKLFLEGKGIPYAVLRRHHTSMEYAVLIERLLASDAMRRRIHDRLTTQRNERPVSGS